MATYLPVLTGETPELRAHVEGVLGDDARAFDTQLVSFAPSLGKAVCRLSSGFEVKAEFVPDPSQTARTAYPSKDELYLETVWDMGGWNDNYGDGWPKGAFVTSSGGTAPVMANQLTNGSYNSEFADSDIIEIRSMPADLPETNDRYWQTLGSLGNVASRHGMMAIVLSSQLSFAFRVDGGRSSFYIDFRQPRGATDLLGALAHNLSAVTPLHLGSGLGTGPVVHEAYPGKDTCIAIHPFLIEARRPTVGIIDPRIDSMAASDALQQASRGSVPDRVRQTVSVCHPIEESEPTQPTLAVSQLIMYDPRRGAFICPQLIDPNAHHNSHLEQVDLFLAKITNRDLAAARQDRSLLMRNVMGDLRLRDSVVVARAGSPYKKALDEYVANWQVRSDLDRLRVLPVVEFDSPDLHLQRRTNIARSATVRRILGAASAKIAPASVSVRRRQELIDNIMIVTPDSEYLSK